MISGKKLWLAPGAMEYGVVELNVVDNAKITGPRDTEPKLIESCMVVAGIIDEVKTVDPVF